MSSAQNKILVTGSKGFIGTHLTSRLERDGYAVTAFKGDILDEHSYAAIEGENFIRCFHLAGKSFVPDSWINPSEFIRVNTMGTEKILEFCRHKKLPLTFVSSYLYGVPQYLPIDERHSAQPNNPYALSKYLAENLCSFYAKYYNLDIVVLRPFNVYGPFQDKRFLIPIILDQFYNGQEEITLMDLSPRRDYIFIDDLINAFLATLSYKGEFGIFNIGSGYSLSVTEVVQKIEKVSGIKKTLKSKDQVRVNEIPDTVADISLAEKLLGWKPLVKFEEGIRKIIEENYYPERKKVN